jgi:hypothetical protein
MKAAVIFLSAILFAVPALRAGAQVDCETARCAFDQAVNAQCSCTGAGNHGRYVSCIAHVTKALNSCGLLPRNCKGKVTRCAARSTCGKTGFSTCMPNCDILAGSTAGTCSNDPTIACSTAGDCIEKASDCHIRHDGTCPDGTTPGSGSCCRTCAAPDCTPSASGTVGPGCACHSNADCTSTNCCTAVGVCG